VQKAILYVLPLVIAGAAKADLIALEDFSNIGTFSQLNAAVTGSDGLRGNSCVPTSVANGLEYLSNTYGVSNLIQPGYGTVNTLSADMGTTAAGTFFPSEVAGTATYIGPGGQNVSPPVVIAGGQAATGYGPVAGNNIQNNTNPTALQLYNWLSAGDAVEFWIAWSGGGAHSLTLYGIDINTAGGAPTGTGTLSFVDPFGGPVVAGGNSGSAVNIAGATYTTVGGMMFINGGYVGGAANNGQDPDNTANSSTGFIVTSFAQTVAPEPSTWAMGAVALGGLIWARARAGAKRAERAG
jgi:hypothetical protein